MNEVIWKEKHTVYSYEVDTKCKATLPVLFSYMLNSAWNHANSSFLSYNNLQAQGQLWTLVRFLIIINEFPKWNDTVCVETWGKGVDRFFALRDFIIYSENEDKLASATSSWLILDKNTYRPQKLDALVEKFPFQFGKHELNIKLEKLPALTNFKSSCSDTVRFRDLDVNKHVNAAKYMQWILDSYPLEIIENKNVKSFEINFLLEALLGDTISMLIETKNESTLTFLNSIVRKSDNKELCRARVKWT